MNEQWAKRTSMFVVMFLCLLACGDHSASTRPQGGTTPTAKPAQVGLKADLDLNPKRGVPLIQVGVGNDRPVWVMVDTGSVGLRVFPSQVSTGASSGITSTGTPDDYSFGDGTRFNGTVSTAVIRVGSVATVYPVRLQIVDKLICPRHLTKCSDHRFESAGEHTPRIAGVLGIGLNGAPSQYPQNPLLALPTPYGDSWSLEMHDASSGSGGSLSLGAAIPSHAIVFHLSRPTTGNRAVNREAWNDRPTTCVNIATKPVIRGCEPTDFDSGTDDLTVAGLGLPYMKGPVPLPATISLNTDSDRPRTLWRFESGFSYDHDRVDNLPEHTGVIATGVSFFYAHTVYFDDANGEIALA